MGPKISPLPSFLFEKAKKLYIDDRPSRHWYQAFHKRHPQLYIRKTQHLRLSRALVTREDLEEWFQEQDEYLNETNFKSVTLNSIFNCDETNIILCPESEKVFSRKGSRSMYSVVYAGKETLLKIFT